MGKSDRIPPPGPNPREDRMSEKDQEQLRRQMLGGGKPGGAGGEEEEEIDVVYQAEGERSGDPAWKIHHTAGQAEGDRDVIDEELRKREEKKG